MDVESENPWTCCESTETQTVCYFVFVCDRRNGAHLQTITPDVNMCLHEGPTHHLSHMHSCSS